MPKPLFHALKPIRCLIETSGILLVCISILTITYPTNATAQTFTVFDVGNNINTSPYAVNAEGQIVGYSIEVVSDNWIIRGFIRNPDGQITQFDAPNAYYTDARSINAHGDVTGLLYDATNLKRGYVRDADGGFTVFDDPNAADCQAFEQKTGEGVGCGVTPIGINNAGEVTGSFIDTTNGLKVRGFVRDMNGNFTAFDVPDTSGVVRATIPTTNINNRGEVAGIFAFVGEKYPHHAFLRDRDGEFTLFDVPNATKFGDLGVSGINDRGDVVGSFSGSRDLHGFIRDHDANITEFAFGAARINDRGDIAGAGFVSYKHGNVISLGNFIPSGWTAWSSGINNQGTVSGYVFDGQSYHGFVFENR